MNANLDIFITKVSKLYEVEYGDFRRKVSQYLTRFEQSLGPQKNQPDVRKVLNEIRTQVVYQPRPDIETARESTLQLAKKLKGQLA